MRVDLPAPFSPQRPTHSPGRTARSMPSSARTPENSLPMRRISNRYSLMTTVSGADLGLGIEAVLHHEVDVLLRERGGCEQDGVDVLLAVVHLRGERRRFALGQLHGQV